MVYNKYIRFNEKTFTLCLFYVLLIVNSVCLRNDIQNENYNYQEDTIDKEEGEEIMENQITFLKQTETLSAHDLLSNCATCENLKLEEDFIKLYDPNFQGSLETNDFLVDFFIEIVPTWNAIIDDFSVLSIFIAIGNEKGYSQYFSMALWRNTYKSSLSDQEDQYGRKSIDRIIARLDDINRIKFKIIFAKSKTKTTALKNISITTIPKINEKNFNFSYLKEKMISIVPRQQLSIPTIGNLICSPTSLSMVLDYYQHVQSPLEVAGSVFDQGAQIYGNWSFNASYAGGFNDLYTRVQYINDLSTLSSYIYNDQPIVLSIRTQNKDDLMGTIMAYPSGHLIVLKGFKVVDDTWYALVCDPAEFEDDKVNRTYNLQDLLKAWKGYVYVVQTNPF